MNQQAFLQEIYSQRSDYKYPSQAYTAARMFKTVDDFLNTVREI